MNKRQKNVGGTSLMLVSDTARLCREEERLFIKAVTLALEKALTKNGESRIPYPDGERN